MATICIASYKQRKPFLLRAVNSLIKQADKILLCLTDYSDEDILQLKSINPDKIEVTKYDDSLGDAGKFLFSANLKGDVLTCDDDMVYPANYVKTMRNNVRKYKDKAIVSMHGRIMTFPMTSFTLPLFNIKPPDFYFPCLGRVEEDVYVHIIGTNTCAWNNDTIPLSIDIFKSKNMADLHLAIYAQKMNIPLVVVKHNYVIRPMIAPRTIWKEMIKDGDKEQTDRVNSIKNWKINTL